MFLKHRISKGSQTSDWSKISLSDSQISYAATDAWVSLELLKYLIKMHLYKVYRLNMNDKKINFYPSSFLMIFILMDATIVYKTIPLRNIAKTK